MDILINHRIDLEDILQVLLLRLKHFLSMDHMDYLMDLMSILIPIMDLEIQYLMVHHIIIIVTIIIINIFIQHLDLGLLPPLFYQEVPVEIHFIDHRVLRDILVVRIIIIHITMILHGPIHIMLYSMNMVIIVSFLDTDLLVLRDRRKQKKTNTKNGVLISVLVVLHLVFCSFMCNQNLRKVLPYILRLIELLRILLSAFERMNSAISTYFLLWCCCYKLCAVH